MRGCQGVRVACVAWGRDGWKSGQLLSGALSVQACAPMLSASSAADATGSITKRSTSLPFTFSKQCAFAWEQTSKKAQPTAT